MRASRQLLLAGSLVACLVMPAAADQVDRWNTMANAITAEQRETPLARARILALVNAAMFAAMDAVEQPAAAGAASSDAAAAAAAHDVLVALYPDRAPDLSSSLADCLAEGADGVGKVRGYQAGKRAAAAIRAFSRLAEPDKADERLTKRAARPPL
jgi:hypothetical protein